MIHFRYNTNTSLSHNCKKSRTDSTDKNLNFEDVRPICHGGGTSFVPVGNDKTSGSSTSVVTPANTFLRKNDRTKRSCGDFQKLIIYDKGTVDVRPKSLGNWTHGNRVSWVLECRKGSPQGEPGQVFVPETVPAGVGPTWWLTGVLEFVQ